jgi:hypothetical protein
MAIERHDCPVEDIGFLRRTLVLQQAPSQDEDQVQRREPLLTVDEEPTAVRVFVVHEGAKEVRWRLLTPPSPGPLVTRIVVVLLAQVFHKNSYVILRPCVLTLVIVDGVCRITLEQSFERETVPSDFVRPHDLVPADTSSRAYRAQMPVSHSTTTTRIFRPLSATQPSPAASRRGLMLSHMLVCLLDVLLISVSVAGAVVEYHGVFPHQVVDVAWSAGHYDAVLDRVPAEEQISITPRRPLD